MSNHQIEEIQIKLKDVPKGKLLTQVYPLSGKFESFISECFRASLNEKGQITTYSLYPGIELSFFDCLSEENICRHSATDDILEINYCRFGRIGWNMKDGSTIYLGAGDFSVHTRKLCADSVMTLPNGYYSGLCICISLKQMMLSPPDILKEAKISGSELCRKFCSEGTFSILPGNEKTKPIFSGFYNLPLSLKIPYFKLKTQELLLYLHKMESSPLKKSNRYQSQQVEIIKKIHDMLTQNLDKRITIEELSKQFPMNPSTMKALFKAVYGNSVAAHIKEHRMEKAAAMLRNTDEIIAVIAKNVGYESQSKFSAEFKKIYQTLPTEYRKYHKH